MLALDEKTKRLSVYQSNGCYYLVGALFTKEITYIEFESLKKLITISQSRIGQEYAGAVGPKS